MKYVLVLIVGISFIIAVYFGYQHNKKIEQKQTVHDTIYVHDTVYFLESTSKKGFWRKVAQGFYEYDTSKLVRIENEEFYFNRSSGMYEDKPPAPIYGINIDSCYAKSNVWDAFDTSKGVMYLKNQIKTSLDKK